MKKIMTRHKQRSDTQCGSVILVCLVLIALISSFGMIALSTTDGELKGAGGRKVAVQSLAAAESGITEAMRRLKEPTSSPDFSGDTASPPDSDWSAYILTDNGWVTSEDPHYDSSLANYIPIASDQTNTIVEANSRQTGIEYFVRIRHKREYDAEQAGHTVGYPHYLDNDGTTSPNTDLSRGEVIHYGYGDPTRPTEAVQFTPSGTTGHPPVEIITANAMTPDGLKIIEAEVVRNPGIKVLGAIYTEGDFSGNGNAATISGADQCGSEPDIAAIYNLTPATTTVSGGTIAGMVEQGPNNLDLAGYVDTLKKSSPPLITLTADINGGTYGAPGNVVTVYSETSGNVGGLKMSNIDGFGNLIVEGDLVMGGGFTWTGLVVVTGTITFNGGGSGVNISGAVMSESTVTTNGGLEIYYDSCAIDDALNVIGYKLINWKEL